ncbi:hypothetical protein [Corallococcus sp. AB011P]|uniref:hypothetical protein n=1 Tax=Corallococcus sp. AB011P TaxID=2316735 RepID=UPI0013155CF5|nr:hypothetical protein [Corallococcus sp. AB011P]
MQLPILVYMLNNGTSCRFSRYALPSAEYPTSLHAALLVVCTLLAVPPPQQAEG